MACPYRPLRVDKLRAPLQQPGHDGPLLRLASQNETMDTNETDETLFFKCFFQRVGRLKTGPENRLGRKMGHFATLSGLPGSASRGEKTPIAGL